MTFNSLSRRVIQRMRLIGMAIFIIGIVSFAFGVVLLYSANTAHNEEVEQLEMEFAPTSIGELMDLREEIRDYRHEIIKPVDTETTETFLKNYIGYPDGLLITGENTVIDDVKWEAWHSLLLQEKGASVALVTLGTAEMVTYAGIGTLILSSGLIAVGLLVIVISPGINQMRKSIAEISNAK